MIKIPRYLSPPFVCFFCLDFIFPFILFEILFFFFSFLWLFREISNLLISFFCFLVCLQLSLLRLPPSIHFQFVDLSTQNKNRLGLGLRWWLEFIWSRCCLPWTRPRLRPERAANGFFRWQSELVDVERRPVPRIGAFTGWLPSRPFRYCQLPWNQRQHRRRRLRFR